MLETALVSGEGTLPGLSMAAFSVCLHTASPLCKHASLGLFSTKDVSLLDYSSAIMTTSDLIALPKALSLEMATHGATTALYRV